MESTGISGGLPKQDLEGWRLVVGEDSHGQHKWVYLPEGDPQRLAMPQTKEDKYWLGLDIVSLQVDLDHTATF
jgi:hypothetical protein